MKLLVNGIEQEIGADWSIRFIKECQVRPILYYKGKRVTKSWSIRLDFDSPVDLYENANTADI